jgi:hypothetical protein
MIKNVKKLYSYYTNKFSSYEVTFDNNITSTVPLDPANTDYQAIQKWIAEGGEVIDNPPTQENN